MESWAPPVDADYHAQAVLIFPAPLTPGPRSRLRLLPRPLRQRRVLLLLRQLAVLIAEVPEPRSLRLVLAARITAAHVGADATFERWEAMTLAGPRLLGRQRRELVEEALHLVGLAQGHAQVPGQRREQPADLHSPLPQRGDQRLHLAARLDHHEVRLRRDHCEPAPAQLGDQLRARGRVAPPALLGPRRVGEAGAAR